MRLVVVVEHVRAQVWREEALALPLVNALAHHQSIEHVTLLADGIEDPDAVHPPVVALVRRPDRRRNDGQPLRYAHWAREQAQRIADRHDQTSVLSLTPIFRGDIDLPVAEHPRDVLARASRAPNPLSLAMELARERAAVLQLRAIARADAAPRPRSTLRCTLGEPQPGTIGVGPASALPATTSAKRAALRHALRSSLGIASHERAIALSVCRADDAMLLRVFQGVALMPPAERPWILAAGPQAWSVLRRAIEAGIQDRLRVLGPTRRMDAVLAASDIAVHPGRSRPARIELGRFIADTLRMDVPALAGPNAPGAHAVSGSTVDDPPRTPEQWHDRLRDAFGTPALPSTQHDQPSESAHAVGVDACAHRVVLAISSLAQPPSAI